jgi:hypothetical protein
VSSASCGSFLPLPHVTLSRPPHHDAAPTPPVRATPVTVRLRARQLLYRVLRGLLEKPRKLLLEISKLPLMLRIKTLYVPIELLPCMNSTARARTLATAVTATSRRSHLVNMIRTRHSFLLCIRSCRVPGHFAGLGAADVFALGGLLVGPSAFSAFGGGAIRFSFAPSRAGVVARLATSAIAARSRTRWSTRSASASSTMSRQRAERRRTSNPS